jgi:hypothetical protein
MHHVHAICTATSRGDAEDGATPRARGSDVSVPAFTSKADSGNALPQAWWQRWLTRPLAQAAAQARMRRQPKVPAVEPLPIDPGRLSADLTLIRAARIHARPGPVRRRRAGLRVLP